MTTELTVREIADQRVELLPTRETLFFNFNWAGVAATNTSTALNVLTLLSAATSGAAQTILIQQ